MNIEHVFARASQQDGACLRVLTLLQECEVPDTSKSNVVEGFTLFQEHFQQQRKLNHAAFRHQLDFFEKHSSHAAITREDYSLTFLPLSVARYSFIQLSELGCREKNGNAQALKR